MSQPYDPNQAMGWDPAGAGYTGPPASAPPYPPSPSGYPGPSTYGYPGYAADHPMGGYPPGYGPPPYSIYSDMSRRTGRPGQVMGTAVLSYVQAGLLALTGVILLSGSAAVSDASTNDGTTFGWGSQYALAGFGDLVAAGLLIAGGVLFAGGRRLGRTLVSIGLAICLIEAALWLATLSDGGGVVIPWVIFFIVLPIIGSSLSFSAPVRDWLNRTSPRAERNANA
jgi:hypothetical protein